MSSDVDLRTRFFTVNKQEWKIIYSPKQAVVNMLLPFHDNTLIEILKEFIKRNYVENNIAIFVKHNDNKHIFHIHANEAKKQIYVIKISMGKHLLSHKDIPSITLEEDYQVFKQRAKQRKRLSHKAYVTNPIFPIAKTGLKIVKKGKTKC